MFLICLWRKGHTGIKLRSSSEEDPQNRAFGDEEEEMGDWLAKEKAVSPELEDAGHPHGPPGMEGRQNLGSSGACQGLWLPEMMTSW